MKFWDFFFFYRLKLLEWAILESKIAGYGKPETTEMFLIIVNLIEILERFSYLLYLYLNLYEIMMQFQSFFPLRNLVYN